MIEQLEEEFHTTGKKGKKVQILTVLPKSWSIRKIQHDFKVSNYMVLTSMKLVAEKGILWSSNAEPGKVLPPATAEIILCLMKSAGSCQGLKIMFLLSQKARRFIFRNDWYFVT
jgi:hypothetical protein